MTGPFIPGERAFQSHYIGGLVGPTFGLDILRKTKNCFILFPNFEFLSLFSK